MSAQVLPSSACKEALDATSLWAFSTVSGWQRSWNLDGFGVLEVTESPDGLVVTVETTAAVAWCRWCGVRGEAQDRMLVEIRDLPCFGRPARLVWRKRRWRCRQELCDAKTWTALCDHLDAQAVIRLAWPR